jgi:hypothetical protein
MAKDGSNLRWNITGADGEPQFARRIQVDDAAGFFTKGLVIEPGTRGLIVEDGVFLGEVPPGAYELKSFAERLELWSRKQATVILTRMEDLRLSETFPDPGRDKGDPGFPTKENLFVEVKLELTVQVADVPGFLHNYMGAQDVITVDQLRDDLRPLIHRALWSAIGRLSIRDLGGPDVVDDLTGSVDESLRASLDRYGLHFVEIQTISIRHEKFDEQRKRQGEIWLHGEGLQDQQGLDALYAEEELQRIRNVEGANELEVLAYEVESDKGVSVIASKKRRIAILNEIRDATQQGQMDRLTSRDEMKRFLLDRDTAKVLRQEEWDEVVEACSQNKEDRALARKQTLDTLDLMRSQEIFELKAELQHKRQLDELDHRCEIAHRTKSTSNEDHELRLQELRQRATRDHEEQTSELKLEWEKIRFGNQQKRDDSWIQEVHEIEVQKIHYDFEQKREDDKFLRKSREKDDTLDRRIRLSDAQLDRLQRVRDMNAERDSQHAELDSKQQNEQHIRDQERRVTQDGMSTEALVVDADVENAELLVNLKKHEATADSDKVQADAGRNEEMHERLLETQKESQQAIRDVSQKVIDSLIEANRPPAAAPATPPGPAASAPAACTWHVSINGQPHSEPVSLATLQEWARTGQLPPDADLWDPSQGSQWTKATQVKDLAGHFPPPPPPQ